MNYRDKYFEENKSENGWYTCAKCGKKFRKKDIDVDHIVPQKLRETDPFYSFDGLHNLQCLCKHCNRSKKDNTDGVIKTLVKHNAKRAVKKFKGAVTGIFKSESNTKTKKTSATSKSKTATPKTSATSKTKTTTPKTSATTKSKTTTPKTSATTKSKTATLKTSATSKIKTTTPKTSATTKSKTATLKTSATSKTKTATSKTPSKQKSK